MHRNIRLISLCGALLAVAPLAPSSYAADTPISSFDADTDSWIATWGTNPDVTFSQLDAAGLTTSGSLSVNATYLIDSTSWQQMVITKPFDPAVDMTQFTSINMDVKVDPTSTPNGSGNYGYFEVKNPASGSALAAGVTLTSTDWTHISFPIPASLASLNGLIIQLGAGNYKGPVSYNIDNITLTPRNQPAEPPTLTLSRAKAGLSLVASSIGQYDRQNIHTVDASKYRWSGADFPTSYSITFDSFPDNATNPNFQAHIFLVPGDPGAGTAPDYSEPTVIFMDIRSGANNSGSATFRFKANHSDSTSEYYVPGLTTVNSATVLGTWTLTALGSLITMTAPDGTVSSTIDLGLDHMLFGENLRVYFGIMPNSDANRGQGVHISKIEIKQGDTTLLSDAFDGDALNTDLWTVNASAGGVSFVPSSEANWIVSWSLPDTNFQLQVATSLTNPDWTDLDVSATTSTIGSTKQAVIPKSALPTASGNVFFRMIQPAVTP